MEAQRDERPIENTIAQRLAARDRRAARDRGNIPLRAPTEALEAVIHADETLTLEVRFRGRTVVSTPPLGLDVDGHLVEGPLAAIS